MSAAYIKMSVQVSPITHQRVQMAKAANYSKLSLMRVGGIVLSKGLDAMGVGMPNKAGEEEP